MNENTEPSTASTAEPPSAEPQRSGLAQRFGRAGMTLLLSILGCTAVSVIALLLFAFGYAQYSPGGLLSDIRPGRPAPEFDLPLLDGGGERVKLSDYRGRPVAVNFWATFCPNCVAELPMLVESEQVHAEQDFAVIFLNAGQTRLHVRTFLADNQLELPVLIDPGKDTYESWAIVGLPTTIWVDREGIVQDVTIGSVTPEIIERSLRKMGELN